MDDAPDPKVEKAQEIYKRVTKDIWDVYVKLQAVEAGPTEDKMNHVKFARLAMISFVHVAAALAVDTLMDEEKFLKVCRESFKATYAAAPKFT